MIAILFVLSWICFDVDMTTGFCWGFCVVNSCSTWYWWAMLTWLVNDNFSFSRSLRASFAVMYCSKEESQDELAVVVTCLSKLWHSSSSRLKSLKNSQVWCEVQVDKPSNLLLTHHLYKWLTCVSGMSKNDFQLHFHVVWSFRGYHKLLKILHVYPLVYLMSLMVFAFDSLGLQGHLTWWNTIDNSSGLYVLSEILHLLNYNVPLAPDSPYKWDSNW